jgi:predicted nuclease of predicted toxin-antitoxin system
MKYLVDAQLPYKLAEFLRSQECDVVHTDDLPRRERTSDETVARIAEHDKRVVITKDSDFLDSYLVRGIPSKLLLVTTGNITNKALFELFQNHFPTMQRLFAEYSFLELSNTMLTVHE